MDDNPIERLLTVLPAEIDMPEATLVRTLVRHTPGRMQAGNAQAAQRLVDAVTTLAKRAEEARLPLALPARMAANRLAAAHHTQVLAWMRATTLPPPITPQSEAT